MKVIFNSIKNDCELKRGKEYSELSKFVDINKHYLKLRPFDIKLLFRKTAWG